MNEQNNAPEGTPEANQDNPLHADFIQSAPENLRDAARELVPVWDQYVQNQFQEHARYKPLSEVSDEEIADFVEYRNRISAGETPEEQAKAAYDWWNEYGQYLKQQAPDLFQGEQEYTDEYIDPQEQYVQQMEQRIQSLEQRIASDDADRRKMEAADFVQGELDKIKPDFGNQLKPDEWEIIKDDICALASRYDPSDDTIIQKGYADYQRIVNNTERTVFERKLTHPSPAERGGTTEAHTGPPLNYEDAGDAAKARIREAMKHG